MFLLSSSATVWEYLTAPFRAVPLAALRLGTGPGTASNEWVSNNLLTITRNGFLGSLGLGTTMRFHPAASPIQVAPLTKSPNGPRAASSVGEPPIRGLRRLIFSLTGVIINSLLST